MSSPETVRHHAGLAHHFSDLQQQRDAAELGMWLFLVTEFMFFGGLFLAYLVYRTRFPEAFVEGSHSMDVVLGTINTAVLLTSSLTMALAVRAAEEARSRNLVQLLLATAVLGGVFLVVKAFEYHHKYEQHHVPLAGLPFEPANNPGLITFFNLYFLMTGLHALHIIIGLFVLLTLAWMARRGRLTADRSIVVHNTGLYWHFVDLVWVYLFPLFYLVGARLSRS
jgi:cytochrome c oxidase subunit 3